MHSQDTPAGRPLLGLALRVVVSAGILAWLASKVDFAHVAAAFRGLRWGWWLGAVSLYLVCQFLCCIRWQLLSRPLGFSDSLTRLTGIYFIGMFFNLFLPTSVGGDAVKAVYIARGSGRKLAAVASVLLDRASGLFALIMIACAALALSPVELPVKLRLVVWGLGAGALIGVASLPWIGSILDRLPLPGKLARIAQTLTGAVTIFRSRPEVLLHTTALSVLVQTLNAVLVLMLGLALNLDVPAIFYGIAAPMVTLVTLIPISLNGMGLREGGMAVFLAPAGVSASDAVTLALLWFCVQTATSLVGGGVYLAGRLSPAQGDADERTTFDRRPGEGRTGERRAAA
jgi:uncharacterized membrane protein YbhN (UPF0104 family)